MGPAQDSPAVVKGLGVVVLRAQAVVHVQRHTVDVLHQQLAHLLHDVRPAAEESAAVVIDEHGEVLPRVLPFVDAHGHRVAVGAVHGDMPGGDTLVGDVVPLVLPEHFAEGGHDLQNRGVLPGLGHEVAEKGHPLHGLVEPGVHIPRLAPLGNGLDQYLHPAHGLCPLAGTHFFQQLCVIVPSHMMTP